MQPQIKLQHSMDGCISGNEAISAHAGVKGKKNNTKATEEKDKIGGYLCGS